MRPFQKRGDAGFQARENHFRRFVFHARKSGKELMPGHCNGYVIRNEVAFFLLDDFDKATAPVRSQRVLPGNQKGLPIVCPREKGDGSATGGAVRKITKCYGFRNKKRAENLFSAPYEES